MRLPLYGLPVSLFAVVMGLAGLTLAWKQAEAMFGWQPWVSGGLTGLSLAVFILLAFGYALKAIRHPARVQAEIQHPIKLNFIPAISISLILLSVLLLEAQPVVSRGLWFLGTAGHLLLTFYIMGVWIHHTRFEIHHMNPAWFIPVVGNILVPIAGVDHAPLEVSWFFFSIGLVFWIVLLAIVFNRFFFHQPLPAHLLPTLFILIAPPAAGFVAYVRLQGIDTPGALDVLGRVLYYSGLFTTLLILTQVRIFMSLPFSPSWWAYSFPLSAITVASFLMANLFGGPWSSGLAIGLLVVTTGVIARLIGSTVRAMHSGALFETG